MSNDNNPTEPTATEAKEEHFGAILCKSGIAFAGTSRPNDQSWLLEVVYYQLQGCTSTITRFPCRLQVCDCEHCKTLIHQFEDDE